MFQTREFFCRYLKRLVLKPSLWLKALNAKRKQAVVSALRKGEKACNSPRSKPNKSAVFSEDDQVLVALTMTEKIATQLERIFKTLVEVESRLQNLECIFERSSALKKSACNLETEFKRLASRKEN